MPSVHLLDRGIQPRHDSDEAASDDYDEQQNDSSENETDLEAANDSNEESAIEDDDQDNDTSEDHSDIEEKDDLKDISFGALAKAQESFAPQSKSRKRKISETEEPQPERSYVPPPVDRTKDSSRPNQPIHRTSKHAPTILSSKHPVSRKRPQIFDPSPSLKSRDPRFDPTVTSTTLNPQSTNTINKNYAFLTTYQATEILSLKSQIKKSKDPSLTADLKRQVMSMESKIRNAEYQQKEREVLQRHKQQEKQAIREGKKDRPYFLKRSDVRKEVEKERLEGMGKKARDTMEKRKIKRLKGKEKRDMPGIMVRRSAA